MNIKVKIIVMFVALLTVFGCKKDEKFVDKVSGEAKYINILRFENALFEGKHDDMDKYLSSIRNDYPDLLFSTELNESLKNLVDDSIGQMAYKSVEKCYSDLSWLEKLLTNAFAKMQKSYPDMTLPKFYTMIAAPAPYDMGFARRIFADKSAVVIAIDWYSLDEQLNKIYGVPQYMVRVMDSAFLAVDIVKTYLREVITLDISLAMFDANSDLLSLMIEMGKFDWAATQFLGCEDWTGLRYTKAEWDWCEANEHSLWGYLVQNKLLFETERMKFASLLFDAPKSKGIEGSPARIAEYLGYKIVKKYAERKKMPVDVLFLVKDANKILKESNYKPEK